MKRYIVMWLSAMLFVGVILGTDLSAQVIFQDDFDDGSINTTLWTYGGAKSAWTNGITGGDWSWSHVESGGDLEMRVWGPTSGGTYGAAAWLQTKYNFNDGKSYLINFSWQPQPIDSHCNGYFMQLTDGWVSDGYYGYPWPTYDNADPPNPEGYLAGTTNLLWNDEGDFSGRGWWFETDVSPGILDWSVRIASSGTAALFDAPDGGGQLLKEQSLNKDVPWYFRFVLTDATSAGFPAGDARMVVDNVQVSECVVPEPSTVIVWSLLGGIGLTVGWWRRRKST